MLVSRLRDRLFGLRGPNGTEPGRERESPDLGIRSLVPPTFSRTYRNHRAHVQQASARRLLGGFDESSSAGLEPCCAEMFAMTMAEGNVAVQRFIGEQTSREGVTFGET